MQKSLYIQRIKAIQDYILSKSKSKLSIFKE